MSGRGAPAGEIKNKQPADQQITAEQVLREAKELQLEDQYTKPKQVISDQHELAEYRLRERKKFEDEVRRVGRIAFGIWVKYATFEEKQKDLRRARNVWERALHTAQHHLTFWLKYAEMEMRSGMVNHARNVWSRATQVLPRIDQLWYKWIHMEEMLGQIESAMSASFDHAVAVPECHGNPLLAGQQCCWRASSPADVLPSAQSKTPCRAAVPLAAACKRSFCCRCPADL